MCLIRFAGLLKGGGYNPVDLSIQSRWFQGDMFILTLTGSPVIYCRIRRNRILLDLNLILVRIFMLINVIRTYFRKKIIFLILFTGRATPSEIFFVRVLESKPYNFRLRPLINE